jgi:hypothetical protein
MDLAVAINYTARCLTMRRGYNLRLNNLPGIRETAEELKSDSRIHACIAYFRIKPSFGCQEKSEGIIIEVQNLTKHSTRLYNGAPCVYNTHTHFLKYWSLIYFHNLFS